MTQASKSDRRNLHPTELRSELETNILDVMAGIYDKIRRWADRELKKSGLTYPQYMAISYLLKKQGITQRELAEKTDSDTTTIMVICDSLEKKNLLKRQADPSDRRVNRLFLTDDGMDVLTRVQPRIQDGQRSVFADIPWDRMEETFQLLAKLYTNASSLLKSAD